MQSGKWRRQILLPDVLPCTDTAVAPGTLRLPRNQGEGDIPLMAVVTGNADALECALRDVGVDDAEFTGPGGGGRVQLFVDNGVVVPGALDQSNLPGVLSQYDAVFYDCDGLTPVGPAQDSQPIVDFVNGGGWVYMSHFDYGILENPPFASTMTLAYPTEDGSFDAAPGLVDTSSPDGQAMATWLGTVDALSGKDSIEIEGPKHDLNAANAPARSWIATGPTSSVGATTQLYSFGAPLGPSPSCGGIVYASYHVSGADLQATTFPGECLAPPASAQEKAFAFLVFDVPTCAN